MQRFIAFKIFIAEICSAKDYICSDTISINKSKLPRVTISNLQNAYYQRISEETKKFNGICNHGNVP